MTDANDEQFSRIERMIGSEGLRVLSGVRVVVVGLGAVGSYAVEALARSGVGTLRVVDIDVVRVSNINRQLYALHTTVGRPKVDVAAERIAAINPACRVEPMQVFVHTDTLNDVLAGRVNMVIDAIDSLTPKVALLAEVVRQNLPVISCMGAALRTEPLDIRVDVLSNTTHCPLARKVRKWLWRREVTTDFTCVYSREPTMHLPESATGEPQPDSSTSPDHAGDYERGRPRRVLGSLPTLTGIMGLVAANTALRELLGEHWPR